MPIVLTNDKNTASKKGSKPRAAETGFNSIRIIPEFYVWQQDRDGFMKRFERYIDSADKNGISSMIVLGNDCCPPKEEALSRLHLGEQKVDWGYHGGRKVSQHGTFDGAAIRYSTSRKTKHNIVSLFANW